MTLTLFCNQLKTQLFGLVYGGATWLFRLLQRAI